MNRARLTLIILSLSMFAAWGGTFYLATKEKKEYQAQLAEAKQFEEKEIYIDAARTYKSLLKINPEDFDLVMKYGEMSEKLGNETDFLNSCELAKQLDQESAAPYLAEAKYYLKENEIASAIDVLKEGAELENEEIDQLLASLLGEYNHMYASLSDIDDWNNEYVAAEKDGKWGLMNCDGDFIIPPQFDDIGTVTEEVQLIPVLQNDEWFYIDKHGNRKLVSDDQYSYLGLFSEGIAPAELNGKAGYINQDFEQFHFEYSYVSAMKNGVAAVKNNQNKWALIDNDFNLITEFIYDDVVLDSNRFCTLNEVIFVKQNGVYSLIDLKGNPVGNEQFQAAKPFASNQPAAVKKDGKWGFVDSNGEMIIEPQYQNANSFSCGRAGVLVDNQWGFIDSKNRIQIEPTFTSVKPFSVSGVAPVKSESSEWQLIQLYEYM